MRRTLNAFDGGGKANDATNTLDNSVKSFLMSTCDVFPLDDVEKLVTNQVRQRFLSSSFSLNRAIDLTFTTLSIDILHPARLFLYNAAADVTDELHSADGSTGVEVVQSTSAVSARHGLHPQHTQSKEAHQIINVKPEIKHRSVLFMACTPSGQRVFVEGNRRDLSKPSNGLERNCIAFVDHKNRKKLINRAFCHSFTFVF